MRHSYCATYRNVTIRPIHSTDLELMRSWRNNSRISTFLYPIPEITPEQQRLWYDQYTQDPNIITFMIEETETLKRRVGNVSLYNFNGTVASAGKTVIGDPETHGMGLAFWGEVLALYIGFEILGITRYITEVHEENLSCQRLANKLGFDPVGRHPFVSGGYETDFIMEKEDFLRKHPFLKEVKLYEETV